MTASLPRAAESADARAGREVQTLTIDLAKHQTAPAGETFLPGPVLLLGAPGVGKGTQAKQLMADFGIPQISTGDLLRDNIAKGTDLGKAAKSLMDGGQLVPDNLVNEMVAARLAQRDVARGYILDGYPRTLNQAEWVDAHLASGSQALPLVAVSIVVGYDELLRRITGRRLCPTGHIYNIYTNPPKVEGKCDIDGQTLIQRSDDSESVFHERMKTFDELTAPVIAHYRKQGRFEEIDGSQSVEAVTAAIVDVLHRLRGKGRQ
jgi:adenylate kinase